MLAHEGRLISASCPSGPAFEGGRVSCGLRAASGAICACRLGPGGEMAEYQTLDDAPAVGLCGSGLLELAAELIRQNALDVRGLLGESHPRMRRSPDGSLEYLLLEGGETGHGRDLVITQQDLAELQLAKAAVYSGIALLLEAAGLAPGDLREVMVAGAFGAHLDLEQAIFIKMLPRIPLERYSQVGNAAGSGARLALLSLAERRRARELAQRTGHLELTGRPDFSRVFARGLKWGEADDLTAIPLKAPNLAGSPAGSGWPWPSAAKATAVRFWGELVLDDGLIADYLKTENVDHARRREFVERLGLDLVCLNLSRGYDEWPGLAAWAKDGDRFIFAVLDGGFQRGIVDMGFEPFLLAVARKNTDLHDYFRKANQQSLELAHRALGEGADGILVADDIAYNHGLLAPPSFFHAFYLPALQGFINDLEPGKATVFFHSDGDLHELLPELANCGLNGLQGLESAAGMDLTRAPQAGGKPVLACGAIMTQPGSPEV